MRLLTLCATTAILLPSASPDVLAQTRARAAAPVIPTHRVVDGIVVLQHRPDAFKRAPEWSLAPEPVATAGGIDAPEYDLTHVQDVEMLSDGRLVTLASVGNRFLLFAADGTGEKVLARQGNGPGDIMSPNGISQMPGDTLVLVDDSNNRINWIVVDEGFVADIPLPRVPNRHSMRPVGVLRGGQLVMSTSGLLQTGIEDSVTRPPAFVIVLSPDATSARVVDSIPDLELVLVHTRYRGRPGTDTRTLGFTRVARVVAWDTVIATGSGDGYRIDLRDPDGRVRSSLRVAIPRRPATRAMRESRIKRTLARLKSPSGEGGIDPAESRRLVESQQFADSLPPYGKWFVSPDRTLWILDAVAPGETNGGATAFRQDGAILGRVTWSDVGSPVAFRDDRVVMREADADGVISLHVYKILKETP